MRQLNSTAKNSLKELDTGAAAAAAAAAAVIRLLIADGACRLSFQQFNEFLANIKKLNSHLQTRDETLTKVSALNLPLLASDSWQGCKYLRYQQQRDVECVHSCSCVLCCVMPTFD